MLLNSWRIRIGAIAASIVLLIAWKASGVSLFPGAGPRVLIEFGADAEGFAGLTVEVDGQAVGRLERVGQATRNAFPVGAGTHSVRVVGDGATCRPLQVSVDESGAGGMILLEHDDAMSSDGRVPLVLRP